ncbi:MAG: ATP phosphoribosyltransferase regulatory subunit, partial [Anaerolineaceae bacterium]|nr:ATP phosphoribosyltransferase regulatory subunit [Anaerolineaceae bacterium]
AGGSEESPFAPQFSGDIGDETALAGLLRATLHGTAMGGRDHRDIARRLLRKRQRMSERGQLIEALHLLDRLCQLSQPASVAFTSLAELTPMEARPVLQSWEESLALLASYGLPLEQIVIQPDLARSWDYYSGMVFELHDSNGRHLGGGGRYDDLLTFMGASTPVPAVGFACWLVELETVQPEPRAVNAFTVLLEEDNSVAAIRLAQLLRSNGLIAELADVRHADTLVADAADRIRWRDRVYSQDELQSLLEALRSA